jgi:large subunit ribosomal protein L30
MADKKITVKLVKSVIGTKQDHRATVRGLGLRNLSWWIRRACAA